jgi:glycosyltransferase involved in cell wall biosynthesis
VSDRYLLSVIVPVYNVGKYLTTGIESIVSQENFNNIDVILIDDGSQDNSGQICDEYANKYENIRVFHQTNQGVSEARNLGIRKALTDYIGFFDADDIASKDLYLTLYKNIKSTNADISIVDYSMVFEDGTEKKHRPEIYDVIEGQGKLFKAFFADGIITNNPIDKLFHKDILEKVSFPSGYAIGEDMYFVYKALKNAGKVVIDTRRSLYKYFIRKESAMHSNFTKKYIDPVELSRRICDQEKCNAELYEYAYSNYIHEICKMLKFYYQAAKPVAYQQIYDESRNALKQYKLSRAKQYMNKKHLVALVLMKYFPGLYIKIYDVLKIG